LHFIDLRFLSLSLDPELISPGFIVHKKYEKHLHF